eukprot:3801604-Amphidinium_carterae.1
MEEGARCSAQNQMKKRRGGGRRSDSFDGWHCSSCNFYNFGFRPVCFACKQAKTGKKDPPGVPTMNPKPAATIMEQTLKKQIADAKKDPALQQIPNPSDCLGCRAVQEVDSTSCEGAGGSASRAGPHACGQDGSEATGGTCGWRRLIPV